LTLYIPGPLLIEGQNEVDKRGIDFQFCTIKYLQIIIMENYRSGFAARFTDVPNYGIPVEVD